MGILRQAGVFRPVGGGWGGEAVCGRGAAGGSRRGGITSGTVGSRNAWGKCGAGRQRSGNGSAAPNLGRASGMPRRNASGENSGHRRPNSHRKASPPRGAGGCLAVNSGAWSRSRRHPEIFCDRPGCYEPPRDSPRAPASYCGDDCRAAMRQARDRERKWLRRKTEAGRFKRRLEYQAARAKRREDRVASGDTAPGRSSARSGTKAGHPLGPVLFYRRDGDGSRRLTGSHGGHRP